MTLWARFKAAGLPADKAVEHLPRSELIAVGTRGTVVVLVVVSLLLGGVWAGVSIYGWNRRRRHPDSASATEVTMTSRLDRWGERALRVAGGRLPVLALEGIVLLAIAAFWSWKALALATVLVSFCIVVAYDHRRGGPPALWMIVVMALAVGLAGIFWQVEPPVLVQTVFVTPPPCTPDERRAAAKPCAALKDVAVPYFGETEKLVFVAEIREATPNASNGYDWRYSNNILELKRDAVSHIFVASRGRLEPDVPGPYEALWNFVEDLS